MTDGHLVNQTRALSATGCSTSLPGGLTRAWDTKPGQPSSLTGAWPRHSPIPNPKTSWRAIRQLLLLRQSRADAQTLNNPGPAAELCIISDRLARLQDANQPQIKSSSKLMSNHILSVQLHSVTLCATGREQEEPCTAAAPAPGPNSAPQICLFSCQGDQCGHAQLPEHRGVFLSYQGAALFSMEKHQPSPKHQGFNWTIKDAANNHERQQLTETR